MPRGFPETDWWLGYNVEESCHSFFQTPTEHLLLPSAMTTICICCLSVSLSCLIWFHSVLPKLCFHIWEWNIVLHRKAILTHCHWETQWLFQFPFLSCSYVRCNLTILLVLKVLYLPLSFFHHFHILFPLFLEWILHELFLNTIRQNEGTLVFQHWF